MYIPIGRFLQYIITIITLAVLLQQLKENSPRLINKLILIQPSRITEGPFIPLHIRKLATTNCHLLSRYKALHTPALLLKYKAISSTHCCNEERALVSVRFSDALPLLSKQSKNLFPLKTTDGSTTTD